MLVNIISIIYDYNEVKKFLFQLVTIEDIRQGSNM